MRKLTVSIDRFPIAGKFTIARGSRTEAVVVTATISEGGAVGHGECVPYPRYGETVEGVAAAIEGHVFIHLVRQHRDVAVADEVRSDEPVDLQGDDVARAAGKIDDRIGPLLRRAGGIFCDQEPDRAAIKAAAVLRGHEVEAGRFAKLFGPRQLRARRVLKTRQLCRVDVLGACQSRRGEEKSEQEEVPAIDSQGASLPSRLAPADTTRRADGMKEAKV